MTDILDERIALWRERCEEAQRAFRMRLIDKDQFRRRLDGLGFFGSRLMAEVEFNREHGTS